MLSLNDFMFTVVDITDYTPLPGRRLYETNIRFSVTKDIYKKKKGSRIYYIIYCTRIKCKIVKFSIFGNNKHF